MKPNIYECKACKAKIVYLKTVKGKFIPVNYEVGIAEGVIFDRDKHSTHFATCPNAKVFRKPVKRAKECEDIINKDNKSREIDLDKE